MADKNELPEFFRGTGVQIIPPLTCPGCKGRDKIIQALAEWIDEKSDFITQTEMNEKMESIKQAVKEAA